MAKVEDRYRRWRATPQSGIVLNLFRRFAQEALGRGRRFGMKAVAERVRWETMRSPGVPWLGDTSGFEFNNNYVAYIARELMSDIPELKEFIEIRKTRAERDPFPPSWMARIKGPRMIPTVRAEAGHGRR